MNGYRLYLRLQRFELLEQISAIGLELSGSPPSNHMVICSIGSSAYAQASQNGGVGVTVISGCAVFMIACSIGQRHDSFRR